MPNVRSLFLPNAVQYWVNICKNKYKLAMQCLANCGYVVSF